MAVDALTELLIFSYFNVTVLSGYLVLNAIEKNSPPGRLEQKIQDIGSRCKSKLLDYLNK